MCGFALIVFALLKYTDKRVMPSVVKIMENYGVRRSTIAIDGAVKDVIEKSGIKTEDLYVGTYAQNGRLTSLSANTVLINSLCADVAERAFKSLEEISDETVYLPLGIITGLDFLAAKGPPVFKITVTPMGSCYVDYKTSFKSEGINQVNYQIWLEIKADVGVVNPVMSKNFTVERRIAVVNTYISGDVPESMFYGNPFLHKQTE